MVSKRKRKLFFMFFNLEGQGPLPTYP